LGFRFKYPLISAKFLKYHGVSFKPLHSAVYSSFIFGSEVLKATGYFASVGFNLQHLGEHDISLVIRMARNGQMDGKIINGPAVVLPYIPGQKFDVLFPEEWIKENGFVYYQPIKEFGYQLKRGLQYVGAKLNLSLVDFSAPPTGFLPRYDQFIQNIMPGEGTVLNSEGNQTL
jgi:hypothetical protein